MKMSTIPKAGNSVAVMLLLWGLMFFWNISWAGLMFVVASEILPSNIRGIGMGLAIAGFWLLAFVFQLIFRLMILTITPTGKYNIDNQIFIFSLCRHFRSLGSVFNLSCCLRLVQCSRSDWENA